MGYMGYKALIKCSMFRKFRYRIAKLTKNMESAYARPTCGFFDPSIKIGGPDPSPELNPRGQKRRPVNLATNRAKRSNGVRRGSDLAIAPIRNNDVMMQYRKGNPLKGLQDILLGFRYWAERYINECHGQRGFRYISTKGQKYMRKVLV